MLARAIRLEMRTPPYQELAALPVQAQEAMLREQARSVRAIAKEVKVHRARLLVLDGGPGVGKTTLVSSLLLQLRHWGIPTGLVSMDDDVLERSARKDRMGREREILAFHPGEIAREAIHRQFERPKGTQFTSMAYDGATGQRSRAKTFSTPGEEGVLILEGLGATQVALDMIAHHSDLKERTVLVSLVRDEESAQAQRFWRDTSIKGLQPDEVHRRIQVQSGCLGAYETDMQRDLAIRGGSGHSNLETLPIEVPMPGGRVYPDEGEYVAFQVTPNHAVSWADFRALLGELAPNGYAPGSVVKIEGPDGVEAHVITQFARKILEVALGNVGQDSRMKLYVPKRSGLPEAVEWEVNGAGPVLVRSRTHKH